MTIKLALPFFLLYMKVHKTSPNYHFLNLPIISPMIQFLSTINRGFLLFFLLFTIFSCPSSFSSCSLGLFPLSPLNHTWHSRWQFPTDPFRTLEFLAPFSEFHFCGISQLFQPAFHFANISPFTNREGWTLMIFSHCSLTNTRSESLLTPFFCMSKAFSESLLVLATSSTPFTSSPHCCQSTSTASNLPTALPKTWASSKAQWNQKKRSFKVRSKESKGKNSSSNTFYWSDFISGYTTSHTGHSQRLHQWSHSITVFFTQDK